MDWITILKAQQTDFIQRLKSGDLLHCQKEGQHSELTVISGDRLQQLRDFCWKMAEKYRHTSSNPIRDVFVNNLKGKLGEEVVKSRLGDFVTEVDYEKYSGGDGKVDFTLTSDSSIGIQVKTRYGNCDQVQWTIDSEEIEKNSVLVCILCQEEFSENEKEYRLIMVGFLPTYMIKYVANEAIVRIDELLYPGGLRGYLESFIFPEPNDYINYGYNLALVYNQKAMACRESKDYLGALSNYNKAILSNPNISAIYNNRGIIHEVLGNMQSAINDYTQALLINPNLTEAYYNRGKIYKNLGNIQGAIDDYTQALLINPADTELYYKRGLAHSCLGNKQAAIDNFKKAASIYLQENNFHDYHKTLEQLKNIQCHDVDLISALGMDYRKLRDLLKTGKWTKADEETRRLMLAVTKREQEGYLGTNSIDNFPCEDLRTIDYLWVKYSNGKFGFSVQKRIYQDLTETYDSKIWDQFIHKIGRYIYEIKAPQGYFPGSVGGIWLGWEEGVGYEFVKGWFDDYLFRRLVRRLEICKIYNIKSETIYEPLTKHNTQVSDDYEDNYSVEDLNNNDDYDDSYQEEYDDMYYSKDMQKSDDYRSSDYGYLEDFDQSSFYDYFN